MIKKLLFMLFLVLTITHGLARAATINIVAAENVYGEVAKEIGGKYVNVLNILNNPSQDPHLFTINPSTAKSITDADIIVYNGADYDPWMKSLLANKSPKNPEIINIAQLMSIKPGSNPHIWYITETMPTYADYLANQLIQRDPQNKKYYKKQLAKFKLNDQSVILLTKQLKQRFQNTPVIATEPVFNYAADSIGLDMHGKEFQLSVMNDISPTIDQIKQFEDDLREHHVKILIYNKQVVNSLTKQMLAIAQKEKIPVVGVSEMLPPGMTYTQWMVRELTELKWALESLHGKPNA